MTTLREAAQQALEALEWHLEKGAWGADIEGVTAALRTALAEPQSTHSPECYKWHHECAVAEVERLRAALTQQAKPLTIERLRDALVASRIIPPAAVEEPDGYDDGVTLLRIEALHRRIT